MSDLSDNQVLSMMVLARYVEKRESILVRQGKSWTQIPSSGHEGNVALIGQLLAGDYLFAYYRSTHLRLAKGIGLKQMARDFFAKATSTSGGRSVSVHCGSRELNVFPDAAPTGAQCLPAAGAAWAQKLNGSNNITVCSIGDGSTRQGEFYEAVCFAVQEKLPIVFLVEDNGYAISTPTDKMNPLKLEIFSSGLLRVVDGTDPDQVKSEGEKAICRARGGEGPTILWSRVSRIGPHTIAEDHGKYRDKGELSDLTDPIQRYKTTLVDSGRMSKDQIEEVENQLENEIAQVYKEVELESGPDVSQINTHIYCEEKISIPELNLPVSGQHNMLTAVKETLRKGLESCEKAILYGQDIRDPKGGVFGITQGLSEQFPDRVINSPLAEATMIGSGVGLAAEGYKPVCEIQFIDFITPGFNQLVTHVANLRWRTESRWSCPMLLYATYGAYLPSGGLWHSQSNDAWWAHIPGLKLAIPSNGEDAAGLFWTAIHSQDPILILLPKHLLRIPCSIDQVEAIEFGKAKVMKEGSDVTLVTWGNCVEVSSKAIALAEDENVSVELIDLRSLVPCDWQTISNSVKKTGRLVVVHEDTQTCGFGANIVAELVGRVDIFTSLWTPPKVVARRDINIPYHPELEREVLPSAEDVSLAIRTVCADKVSA